MPSAPSLCRFPLVALLAATCLTPAALAQQPPIRGEQPQSTVDTFVPEPAGIEIETWVDSLSIPWSIVFLPNGDALIAERPGRIQRVPAGSRSPVEVASFDVVHDADIGLMGLAAHPDFANRPFVYAMYAYRNGDNIFTRVVRLAYAPEKLTPEKVILDRIPSAIIHAGGRIAFGPDGMLYIGTGDTGHPPLAQDLHSLAGKILRLTPDGDVPADNPFPGSPVYSLGHRAVQGLAWDPATGAMFASEHGPSGFPQEGGVRNRDEINRILPGKNYGWPMVVGAPGMPEYEDPIAMWPSHSVPPSGIAFYEGDLFVSTLRTQALIRIRFGEDYAVDSIERWFADNPNEGRLGRLRTVTAGPDGYIYVGTGNKDGKAALRPGDDRILRIRYTR
ncbi:MAG: PQQ-dependent sugar dehydrogenase [Rhodothermales bacterium]